MERGYTLVELALVLLILAMGSASLAPAARRYRDAAGARSAREAVAGLVSRARALAVAGGGALVTIEPATARAWISVADSVLPALDLEADFGATLSSPGAGGLVELSYDALGVGRAASRTLVFRVGEAESRLVVSSYGRLRRQ